MNNIKNILAAAVYIAFAAVTVKTINCDAQSRQTSDPANTPYVDRVEWRTETNRVDTARTSPIVRKGYENHLAHIRDTIHYTETVWSNLTAIVVYSGKEFPVVVEKRLAWAENKSRFDGLPVVINAKGHAEVSELTNIISGWTLTNQWGVGR